METRHKLGALQLVQTNREEEMMLVKLPLHQGSQNLTMVNLGVLAATYLTEPCVRNFVVYRMPDPEIEQGVQDWLVWHLQVTEAAEIMHTDLRASLVGFRAAMLEFAGVPSISPYAGEEAKTIYSHRIDILAEAALNEVLNNAKYGRGPMATAFWEQYSNQISDFGRSLNIRNHILVHDTDRVEASVQKTIDHYTEFDHYTIADPLRLVGWYARMLAVYQMATVFRNIRFDVD